MSSIQNIVVDLGNVLLDIDFQRLVPAFEKLGVRNFDKQFSLLKTDELFVKIETGQISSEEFLLNLRSNAGISATDDQLSLAWNAMLLEFRKESIQFLERIKPHYRLFLLSNTNAIHLIEINKILARQSHYSDLRQLFEKAYFSHEVGLRKPDPDIYSHVMIESNLLPTETLFIDDLPANIKPAQSAGWKTHVLLPNERIEHLPYWGTIS